MAFGSLSENGGDAPMSDINVTPLVDVMLVLMIVFMITMPVLTHSVQIDLPTTSDKPEGVQQLKAKEVINLAVNVEGKYAIGAESSNFVDFDSIKVQLQEQYVKDKDMVVAIDADKSASYGDVAKVIDVAREIGFQKIGFNLTPESTK